MRRRLWGRGGPVGRRCLETVNGSACYWGCGGGRYARAIFLETDALQSSTTQFQKSVLLLRLRSKHRQEILLSFRAAELLYRFVAMHMP